MCLTECFSPVHFSRRRKLSSPLVISKWSLKSLFLLFHWNRTVIVHGVYLKLYNLWLLISLTLVGGTDQAWTSFSSAVISFMSCNFGIMAHILALNVKHSLSFQSLILFLFQCVLWIPCLFFFNVFSSMLYIISDQSLIGCLTIQCVSKIKNGLAARYKNFQKLRSFVKRKIKNLCKCFFKRSITCIITLFITCDYLSQFSIWKNTIRCEWVCSILCDIEISKFLVNYSFFHSVHLIYLLAMCIIQWFYLHYCIWQ